MTNSRLLGVRKSLGKSDVPLLDSQLGFWAWRLSYLPLPSLNSLRTGLAQRLALSCDLGSQKPESDSLIETTDAQTLLWDPKGHTSGPMTGLPFHLRLSTMVPAMLTTGTLSNYCVCPHTLLLLHLIEWTH